MKSSGLFLGAFAQVATAHYFFESVVTNGAPGPAWEYIRQFSRGEMYNPIKFSSNPAGDIRDNSHIDGPDIICNQNAFAAAGNTGVMTVDAGSEVTVRLGVGATMQHPGPSMAYMSRAPNDDVSTYEGDGDWFKIFDEGVCNQGGDFTTDAWCSWDKDTITATIPNDTPDGEYLLRFEHIGIHRSHVNQPEHYVSCVQVQVTNGGSGAPGPMTQFPGAYSDSDEYANFSIYNGFKDFPMPGPAVWSGGGRSDDDGSNEGGNEGGNDAGNGVGDDVGDDTGDDAGNDAGEDVGDDTGNDTGNDTDNGAGDDAGDDNDDGPSCNRLRKHRKHGKRGMRPSYVRHPHVRQ